MIRTAIIGLLLALPVHGGAQESAAAAELARIDAQRERVEAEFAAQEKACYSRFAVNGCRETARKQRRDALADLRRQEIALNDAERRRRADERVRDIEARKAEQRVPALMPPASGPVSREATVPPAVSAEAVQRPAAAASAPPPPASPERGRAQPPEPAASAAPGARTPKEPSVRPAAEAQDNARRHQERLLEAEQHKKRALEKAAENNKASRPLPVPP